MAENKLPTNASWRKLWRLIDERVIERALLELEEAQQPQQQQQEEKNNA